MILPAFGFANAGVPLAGVGKRLLSDTIMLGAALGLFVGKPVGVFGAAMAARRFGLAALPEGASRTQMLGIAMLCGIGFTMSMFIGFLAFAGAAGAEASAKTGVLAGSALSALAGAAVLWRAGRRKG